MFPALAVWCFRNRDMLVALGGDGEDFVVTKLFCRNPLIYFVSLVGNTARRGRSSTQ
jgi:hypothetical protein